MFSCLGEAYAQFKRKIKSHEYKSESTFMIFDKRKSDVISKNFEVFFSKFTSDAGPKKLLVTYKWISPNPLSLANVMNI
jgi:hypothetical protein